MSTENPGSGPVATATPGSPIHVNVSLPKGEPVEAKTPAKTEKAPRSDVEKQRDKGTKRALKALGVPSEERDGLLKEIKETRGAKSLAERLGSEHKARADKAEAELRLLKDQAAVYETLAKSYADEQFNALPENLQKFIAATAGDSLDARLKAIKTAKESGLISAKEAAAATAEVKSEVTPLKPATTTKAVNPKAPPAEGSPTPRLIWQQMREEARAEVDHGKRLARERMAAQYYAANQMTIDSEF
jgi:hypothetical protein